jgi:hypothetical protein
MEMHAKQSWRYRFVVAESLLHNLLHDKLCFSTQCGVETGLQIISQCQRKYTPKENDWYHHEQTASV